VNRVGLESENAPDRGTREGIWQALRLDPVVATPTALGGWPAAFSTLGAAKMPYLGKPFEHHDSSVASQSLRKAGRRLQS
jgi:hypothetical protein